MFWRRRPSQPDLPVEDGPVTDAEIEAQLEAELAAREPSGAETEVADREPDLPEPPPASARRSRARSSSAPGGAGMGVGVSRPSGRSSRSTSSAGSCDGTAATG